MRLHYIVLSTVMQALFHVGGIGGTTAPWGPGGVFLERYDRSAMGSGGDAKRTMFSMALSSFYYKRERPPFSKFKRMSTRKR